MTRPSSIINRIFGLRPGDFARGMPLFLYYLLIVSFHMMSRVARDAIFLDHFGKEHLPYADVSVALLAAIVVAPYIRAGSKYSLEKLQIRSLLFFAVNLFGFWWGLHFHHGWTWLAPLFYVWVGVCGVLTIAQVWTMANFVWTTREAKRLFTLLGSGGIIGGTAGGFLSKWIAEKLGTDSTLLFMMAFLFLSAGLIRNIWKQKPLTAEPETSEFPEKSHNLIGSFRLIRQSRHLLAICALICLSSIVTTIGGWQLKAFAKDVLVGKDSVAAYLGMVAGYTGLISLAAQLFITTRLLRRFGIGPALLVLPLSLIVGTTAILAWGTLQAAAFLRGSDGVFRYSVDTSAVQLLYLPVPADIKLQVKSFIDTVVWKFGDGLAALTLMLFVTTLQFSARQVSWISLALLGAWIAAAVFARRQYVATLSTNIKQFRLQPDPTSVRVLDSCAANLFAEKLHSADENEVIYALGLFEMAQHPSAHSALTDLLDHSSAQVRRKTVAVLNEAGDLSAKERISGLISDPNLDVRTEALLYLSRHDAMDPLYYVDQLGEFADYSIRSATACFLMKPGDGYHPEAALMIIDGIVSDLGDPLTATDAARALSLLGDIAIEPLSKRLADDQTPMELRRRIPGVILRIGSRKACLTLSDHLIQADVELRSSLISTMNKLHEFHPDLQLDRQAIETVMIAELMGHYRSYQILGSASGIPDENLKKSMTEEIARIFRLMRLLFPSLDLQNAYAGIQSSDPVAHANALEFLDNTLSPTLRARLVPLIDSEVSLQERIRIANRLLGFQLPIVN